MWFFKSKPKAPSDIYRANPFPGNVYPLDNPSRRAPSPMSSSYSSQATLVNSSYVPPHDLKTTQNRRSPKTIINLDDVPLTSGPPTLVRQNARHREKEWQPTKRCRGCEGDNDIPSQPGKRAPCQNSYFGMPCPGHFHVSQRDAMKARARVDRAPVPEPRGQRPVAVRGQRDNVRTQQQYAARPTWKY